MDRERRKEELVDDGVRRFGIMFCGGWLGILVSLKGQCFAWRGWRIRRPAGVNNNNESMIGCCGGRMLMGIISHLSGSG